ncbi:hypothetical protein [Gordonia rhizosphera]|uniref:Uncharacterized protein n=1 Tax=Gordonia rhizosphera NBRC 16068 TaxID=1108045 RepID=K6W1G9_9ACTN|nr:hypothetical protein [Gordonia rhizosphera]GAB93015.1 hypothetical protein GORHZ_202_00040 [Gordonia rhizosphera NBRC 16068]
MRREPFIAVSAYRHGVPVAEMLHAYTNPMLIHRADDGFTMIVGPAADATLIEAGYVVSDDGLPVIIHAMSPARRKYLR